ncbi:hypothetical protein N7454_011036 [Penicillium verhagenii]|nr:hypothetical protein N7454_011036 [Penicillium verhagenii]
MSQETRATAVESSSLRLGSIAPNFQAETTIGPIDFHEWAGSDWVILFSHPEDYTPVCTTELAALAKYEPEFTKRHVKLIGLSANSIQSHDGWINDIAEIAGCPLTFPVIGDEDRQIAYAYDMSSACFSATPASTGRNTEELLRVVDSLLATDKHAINTPVNWVPGEDVVVPASVNAQDAKARFPDMKMIKPYLRFTPLPKE